MPDTSAMRTLARRVKQQALEQALFILENPHKVDKEIYNETFLTVLKNSVPRTQEVTGEDGEAVAIKIINYANASGEVSTEAVSNSVSEGV